MYRSLYDGYTHTQKNNKKKIVFTFFSILGVFVGMCVVLTQTEEKSATHYCNVYQVVKAASDIHSKYFSLQQTETMKLISEIEAHDNCSVPEQKIEQIISRIQPFANTHIDSAFILKDACAWAFEYVHNLPSDLYCSTLVLNHEPWNLHEGTALMNILSFIKVNSFPKCSNLTQTWNLLKNALYEKMDLHRKENSFSRITKHWEELCPGTPKENIYNNFISVYETHLSEKCDTVLTPFQLSFHLKNDVDLLCGFYHVLATNCTRPTCSKKGIARAKQILSFFLSDCDFTNCKMSIFPEQWLFTQLTILTAYGRYTPLCGVDSPNGSLCGTHSDLRICPFQKDHPMCNTFVRGANGFSFVETFQGWNFSYGIDGGNLPDALKVFDVDWNTQGTTSFQSYTHYMTILLSVRRQVIQYMFPHFHTMLPSLENAMPTLSSNQTNIVLGECDDSLTQNINDLQAIELKNLPNPVCVSRPRPIISQYFSRLCQ